MGKPSNHPGRSKPPCFVVKISARDMGENWRSEVHRLLESVKLRVIGNTATGGTLHAHNGVQVGTWSYRPAAGKETTP